MVDTDSTNNYVCKTFAHLESESHGFGVGVGLLKVQRVGVAVGIFYLTMTSYFQFFLENTFFLWSKLKNLGTDSNSEQIFSLIKRPNSRLQDYSHLRFKQFVFCIMLLLLSGSWCKDLELNLKSSDFAALVCIASNNNKKTFIRLFGSYKSRNRKTLHAY